MPAPTYSPPKMLGQKWEKLVWNAAFNSLTALSGLNTRTWLDSSEDAVNITKRLMSEIVNVAKADGAETRESLAEDLIKQVCDFKCSVTVLMGLIGVGH
jgi:ketopantoate reductase